MPANILLIHRDRVKGGCEATYRLAEEDAARACIEHGCPHPHLAIESMSGPTEVWWLNAFDSDSDRQRVVDAYTRNGPLTAALQAIRDRREGLLEVDSDTFVHHKPELSRGPRLTFVGARFVTVTTTTGSELPAGDVFEASDGTRYVFSAAATVEEARLATVNRADAVVFAVRPWWGMAARAWIAADPEFWRPNPAAALK
jgi:hypothetical protein